MNSTCCICFEEWKPLAYSGGLVLENFNCGTCNEGKICAECYEKNSKEGQFTAWEYLILETAMETVEHFRESGWTKKIVKGMECVVCKTPNWKQYYYSVIRRTFREEDGILDECLWRAQTGKRIKPCFWVYLKNEHNYNKQLFPEEESYYENIIEAYEEYYKDKHEDAFGKTLKNIRKLKKYNNKLAKVKEQNYKRQIKMLIKKNNKQQKTIKAMLRTYKRIGRACGFI